MRARTFGALLVVAGLLGGCGGTDVAAADAAPPEVTASPVPGPAADPDPAISPVSAETLERLGDGFYTIRVVDPAEEHPQISAAGILKRQAMKRRPIEMALVRTTYDRGEFLVDEMTAAQLAAARRKVASEQNRLMWLLIFDKVRVSYKGPPGGGTDGVSDAATFLDANTGEFAGSGTF
jgi:hypothetical protein